MFRQDLTREELGPLYTEDVPQENGYFYVAEQMYGGKYSEKIMKCICWQRLVYPVGGPRTSSRWTAYKQSISGISMSRMMNKKRRFLVGPKVKSIEELL